MCSDVCIVPTSAHGTNPASAVMCGMKVVVVKTLPSGAVDMDDFHAAVNKHADKLSAFMITYPSTYGVFDDNIRDVRSPTLFPVALPAACAQAGPQIRSQPRRDGVQRARVVALRVCVRCVSVAFAS